MFRGGAPKHALEVLGPAWSDQRFCPTLHVVKAQDGGQGRGKRQQVPGSIR
jgi:hypothetical protein